jgi:hypothetical protein
MSAISRKTRDARRDNPSAPMTKAELIERLEMMRDILNGIPSGDFQAVWEAIGGLRYHVGEALQPGEQLRQIYADIAARKEAT